ncbi:hypothetical protein EDB19DRAFT_1828997 [Suillus lakei]|nr:hypothetical protein EDB19DRAFT_1828997 [Suillus lakei]
MGWDSKTRALTVPQLYPCLPQPSSTSSLTTPLSTSSCPALLHPATISAPPASVIADAILPVCMLQLAPPPTLAPNAPSQLHQLHVHSARAQNVSTSVDVMQMHADDTQRQKDKRIKEGRRDGIEMKKERGTRGDETLGTLEQQQQRHTCHVADAYLRAPSTHTTTSFHANTTIHDANTTIRVTFAIIHITIFVIRAGTSAYPSNTITNDHYTIPNVTDTMRKRPARASKFARASTPPPCAIHICSSHVNPAWVRVRV